MLLIASLLASSLAVADCDSTARCNRMGAESYQKGDYAAALQHFQRQIDYAETAMERAEADADSAALQAARDMALNNAALALMKAGDCLKSRAYLDLARAEARATAANRRQLDARCAEAFSASATTGEYWQYAGHGLWNRIEVRPTGDETLTFDAWWMRTGMGPMDEFGIKAFGEMEQIYLHPDRDENPSAASGRFDGFDPDVECRIELRFLGQAVEVAVTADQSCHTGGAGAVLHGRYVLVTPDLDPHEK